MQLHGQCSRQLNLSWLKKIDQLPEAGVPTIDVFTLFLRG